MLNVTRRDSLTDPAPLAPGEVIELGVDVDATGWRFPAGHRIRVAIAGADCAERLADAGARRPVRPPRVDDRRFPRCPPTRGADAGLRAVAVGHAAIRAAAASTWTVDPRRPDRHGDRDDRDARRVPGGRRHRHRARVRRRLRGRPGIRHTPSAAAATAVAPPATAHGRSRGPRSSSPLTRHDFHVTIELEVTIDGAVVATRSWDERIRRVLL